MQGKIDRVKAKGSHTCTTQLKYKIPMIYYLSMAERIVRILVKNILNTIT